MRKVFTKKRRVFNKKKKVLLIEPDYKVRYLPVSLQKMATYYLKKGCEVEFSKGIPQYGIFDFRKMADLVCVTSVFSFHGGKVMSVLNWLRDFYNQDAEIIVGGPFATNNAEMIERETGFKAHMGRLEKIEECDLNYDLFDSISTPWQNERAVIFTTRGCPRKCSFCIVSKVDPGFKILKKWKRQIERSGKKKIIIQDNSVVASPFEHQKEVVHYLQGFGPEEVDFNSGFDVRLMKKKHVDLYNPLTAKMPFFRIAFDSMNQDGHFQKAVEMLRKANIQTRPLAYILYNYDEPIEEFWYRLNEVHRLGVVAYPMKYCPPDALDRRFVGKHWSKELLKGFNNFRATCAHGNNMIPDGSFTDKIFKEYVGDKPQFFIDNLMKLRAGKDTIRDKGLFS